MRKIFLYSVLLLLCHGVQAQHTVFLDKGRIEFEKKQNIHALLDEMWGDGDGQSWKELEKKMQPKFKTSYFDLVFSGNVTYYKPGRQLAENNQMREWPAEKNVVYTDLAGQHYVAQKQVFDRLFLQDDSTRAVRWKITDETRKIAGFDCRRANAVIMDSIYVVAFYTDAIVTPGGPESFSGLPGMILGLALPHEHITWFATKVLVDEVKPESLKPPAKGKKVTGTELTDNMSKALKDWGNWGKVYLKTVLF
ncbi:GLPGLI family protein [Chitinophaga varians]|uniref:GLPGLI family protein n=1 Tax=Chitinophaga varians TaxID=2202339 RepID=UPI00165FFD19|nr:GLPGLI family protein [Chitinophaga varians]MBC9915113.1 GLPGLI family protein [Chitinophaga varians]